MNTESNLKHIRGDHSVKTDGKKKDWKLIDENKNILCVGSYELCRFKKGLLHPKISFIKPNF